MCTNSLTSPKWSSKESVCVATLLVALILVVLSFLYGDVVLLYLQLFASALAAWGAFSWAPWWTLLFSAPWGSPLCPWGSPWAAGGYWGCLSASCLALYSWGWISLVVKVLLIVSPPFLWLIFCLQ